jgi:glycosyltransferase involved in cell wall biosynthesis
MPSLDLLIPVYNESDDVVARTVRAALAAFDAAGGWDLRVIVIDDGSRSPASPAALGDDPRATLVRHEVNRGYGAALKTGIRAGSSPWIAIADADGTYPVDRLPELAAAMTTHDTVVGTRTGGNVNIPLARRFPKACLNRFASYLAGARIVDLNSGMRVFTRELAEFLWFLFPAGFSFTSTMTMGSLRGGYRVKEIPIDYFKREGSSSIAPIKDTVRFFKLAFRLGLLFAPMRIFAPVAGALVAVGLLKGLAIDYRHLGAVGNFSVAVLLAGIQVFCMGLLAELIVLSRRVGRPRSGGSP